MDRIVDIISELPIGLIIFIIALAFGMFGRDDKKKAGQPREARQSTTPDPYARQAAPRQPSVFASDERRAREDRAQREQQAQEDVLVFGGLDFGRKGSLFDEEDNRDSQWGKTKYGFDESEWGSAFGDKKNSDPIIR